jgi:hypothetical protein
VLAQPVQRLVVGGVLFVVVEEPAVAAALQQALLRVVVRA